MGGGDFDGDTYLVIYNENILRYLTDEQPYQETVDDQTSPTYVGESVVIDESEIRHSDHDDVYRNLEVVRCKFQVYFSHNRCI